MFQITVNTRTPYKTADRLNGIVCQGMEAAVCTSRNEVTVQVASHKDVARWITDYYEEGFENKLEVRMI